MNPQRPIRIFNRLHFKMAAFVITTILVILGLFLAYQLYWYRRQLHHLEMDSSGALCQTLTSSLEIAMLNKDTPAIQHSFEMVAGQAHIVRVFLMDTAGTVRASSSRSMIGMRLERTGEGCRTCHTGSSNMQLAAITTTNDEELLRVVAPVVNKPECHVCHGTAPRYNGLLVMDRSLAPIRAEILANLQLAGVAAAISGLLLMILFRWYFRRNVIDRVVYLESLARRVAANELAVDIHLAGKDELASLARSVSNMRASLKSSIDQIGNHHVYLRNLIENLLDGILIVDEDGRVASANRAVSEILGVDAQCRRTGALLDFRQPTLARLDQIGAMIGAARQSDHPVKEIVVLRTPGHEDKHVEIQAGRLVLPPWLRPEVIVVIRDVTTRITAENQVYQSERLATVGRLAAGIAHEINNPMASILTCSEGLLRVQSGDDAGRREYLQVIKNSAQRCRLITQKLLDYSAASAPTMEPVNIVEVLQESVSLLQFEAGKKKLGLTVTKSGSIPLIDGSKDSLVQVFVNLILNSIQAVDTGGKIVVATDPTPDAVIVSVTDDGPGIGEASLPRIFEPFYTTKPVGMGTGLGLSVSQGIVKNHGGSIEVTDNRKGRTCFRVSLPIPDTGKARRHE